MKILYTNFHAGNGGGHVTYIVNLIRALAPGHQITVATPAQSRLYHCASQIEGVALEDMCYTTRPSSWFAQRARLRRLILAGGFDLIHTNGSADHKQVMLALVGVWRRPRVVFTKHNDHPLTSFGHKLRAGLVTDHSIAVSNFIHQMLVQSPYRRHPITTIPNGIDTTRFVPLPQAHLDTLRERYFGSLWHNKLLLGSAAGTYDDKGWLDLVAAVATLAPEEKNKVLLLVAGNPPTGRQLDRVRQLNMTEQVHFPGLLDDVGSALGTCHVGFVLSYREALSFACREMMSVGLPALISNAGGLPENVTDDVDGWIVPAGDVAAIANKVRFMLAQPETVRKMGENARQTALQKFGLDHFVTATEQVYESTLSTSKA